MFKLGDQVKFKYQFNVYMDGVITKLNPKRAVVDTKSSAWTVVYPQLRHVSETTHHERSKLLNRLLEVASEARMLMDQHGLTDWSLNFNNAKKHLGECNFTDKKLILNREYSVTLLPEQITETILHQISTALAGWEASQQHQPKDSALTLGKKSESASPQPQGLRQTNLGHKEQIHIGDTVTFINKQQETIRGVVVRKNPKTATVKVPDGSWRVSYRALQIEKSSR